VILGILSQNGAFAKPSCDWTKNKHNETRIVIEGCESPKIDPVFLGSKSQEYPHLKTLKIRFASLTVVEGKSFIRATNLKILNLSSNRIERVDKNAFSGLKKLTTLFLDNNKMANLPMGVFAELQELVELYLHHSRLTSFDFSIVKQNHQLKELFIHWNAISNVTTSQQYSSNLTVINMKSNSLTSLTMENLPNCPNLEKLDIKDNKLNEFDFESLKDKFPKLKEFYFRYNQFDCCFLVDMVRAMLLHMPKLTIDYDIINDLNDTEKLQRQNFCVKFVQKRLDELEVIIGNLIEANRNLTMTIEKIGAENQNMAVKIGNLTDANRNMTMTIEKIGAENRNLKVINEILTDANRNTTVIIEKIGAENRNMTVIIGNLTDANRNMTMTIEKIGAENRNMTVNIGNLTDANRNTTVIVGPTTKGDQHLYIMGSAFAIGVAIIDIVLVAVGSIVSRHSRKPEEPKSNNIELQEDGNYTEIE
jgi:Leucine-rich repeat (LRR) protein